MTRIDSFHKVVNVSGWYTPQDGVKVNDRVTRNGFLRMKRGRIECRKHKKMRLIEPHFFYIINDNCHSSYQAQITYLLFKW